MPEILSQDAAAAEIQRLEGRLRQLEEQLIAAQRMGSIGEIASSITHEFNNILTTIINYAKLGLRHHDQASRDKAFDKILSAGQRAAKITTGLLSYARQRGDRRDTHNLASLVRDVLVLMEKDLQVHRIQLDLQIEGEPHASLNAGEIQQVLMNLMINARQAMQPGGVLTVSVRENAAEGFAEIAVRDNGHGIPADKLPQIFNRCYSTKTADAQGQGGSGLGLALCKSVMDSHGGRIRVESALGRGTQFTLKLPLTAPLNIAASCGLPAADSRPLREHQVEASSV